MVVFEKKLEIGTFNFSVLSKNLCEKLKTSFLAVFAKNPENDVFNEFFQNTKEMTVFNVFNVEFFLKEKIHKKSVQKHPEFTVFNRFF